MGAKLGSDGDSIRAQSLFCVHCGIALPRRMISSNSHGGQRDHAFIDIAKAKQLRLTRRAVNHLHADGLETERRSHPFDLRGQRGGVRLSLMGGHVSGCGLCFLPV